MNDHRYVDPRWRQTPGPIIDIGCLGWDWSEQFAGREIIGVDPEERDPRDHVLYRCAVSISDGTLKMGTGRPGSDAVVGLQNDPEHVRDVEAMSLQTLLRRHPGPAVVKMNIEGAEYPLLWSVRHPIADQLVVSFHDQTWLPQSIFTAEATECTRAYLRDHYTEESICPGCLWFLYRRPR